MFNVPEHIAKAAQDRIQETARQHREVLEMWAIGRPLEAEPEEARKIDRVQAATGVDSEAARKIANYVDPKTLGLSGEQLNRAESIQGKTVDFISVAFLQVAQAAASSVARIAFRDLRPVGTGFMISDRLLLTNNHVIPSEEAAQHFLIEFHYELGFDLVPTPVTRFELAPDQFFITNAEDDLDFTVVAVGPKHSGDGDLNNYGYCPLMATTDKHVLGEFVNIVQHPAGDYKQIAFRENQLVGRLSTVLHYRTDTLGGSSGSPVFNDEWEAIALHHWGGPFRQTTNDDGQRVPQDVNEGIRISSIVKTLLSLADTLDTGRRSLLQAALDPGFRFPSLLGGPATPRPISEGRQSPSASAAPVRIDSDGSVTWSIPLEVSVRLGMTTAPAGITPTPVIAPPTPTPGGPTSEAVKIDRDYSNRNGYNPNFLPGHTLDLPILSDEQQADAAQLSAPEAGANPHELKYEHFSVIMSAKRRMAYFTASNINGATWVNILRATGLPSGAEASEKWFDDPRIPAEAQTNQDLYSGQSPFVFDRGHLVRRQDPAWGSEASAIRANADTFHFANAAPQQWQFNRGRKIWLGIEEYVLDNAIADNEKITVLTGPVFTDDDPDYRGLKVPRQFWKILVRVDNGELLATALIADQSDKLPEVLPEMVGERLSEDFGDLGDIKEFQKAVTDIETLTGLDFGPLRDHDTFDSDGSESLSDTLTSFKDVSMYAPKTRTSSERKRASGRTRKKND